jgi:hypothetical protein
MLHEMLGPHEDEMFCHPWYSRPDIPEHQRDTKLKDGVLTAGFQTSDGQGWVQKSFDLGPIVSNHDGMLMM